MCQIYIFKTSDGCQDFICMCLNAKIIDQINSRKL